MVCIKKTNTSVSFVVQFNHTVMTVWEGTAKVLPFIVCSTATRASSSYYARFPQDVPDIEVLSLILNIAYTATEMK